MNLRYFSARSLCSASTSAQAAPLSRRDFVEAKRQRLDKLHRLEDGRPVMRLEFPEAANLLESERALAAAAAGLRPEAARTLRRIALELDEARSIEPGIPTRVKREGWLRLLAAPNRQSRLHWALEQGHRELAERAQVQRNAGAADRIAAHRQAQAEERARRGLVYSMNENSILLMMTNARRAAAAEARLRWAESVRAPRVCLDASSLRFQSTGARALALRQISNCYGRNKEHRSPAFLQVSSAPLGAEWWAKEAHGVLNVLPSPERPVERLGLSISHRHYTELGVPLSQILVLSPDADKVVDGPLDEDVLYVIGAMSDKGSKLKLQKNYTFTKAREHGVRAAKLPLDKYLDWRRGRKQLSPFTTLQIILDVLLDGDWAAALAKHIQPYKTTPDSEYVPSVEREDRTHWHKVEALMQQLGH